MEEQEVKQTEQTTESNRSFSQWYDKNYKLLLVIPAILLILSLSYIFYFYSQNQDIMKRDISLTGGTSVTINQPIDIEALELALADQLEEFSVREISDLRTGKQVAFVVQTTADLETTKQTLENYLGYKLTEENSSMEFTGSALSENFYKQLILAILFAFTFMGAVVFYIFGKNLKIKILIILLSLLTPFIFFILKIINTNQAMLFSIAILFLSAIFYVKYSIPGLAVVLSAFADITMTLALVDFLGWKISSAGIVAFLMLIGYSVDTDIMLTSRLIKRREGEVNSRMFSAFKTGITMTLTSLVAVVVALIITSGFSDILRQIFSILAIGLSFDILNTWLTNATILKWYVEKEK